jgi:hypothetical protein
MGAEEKCGKLRSTSGKGLNDACDYESELLKLARAKRGSFDCVSLVVA